MVPGFLSYKRSQVAYYNFGKGPVPVLCFHGYGEDAQSFEFLAEYAGDQYTFYAIDLPFHGRTEWKEGLNFSSKDLVYIAGKILGKENQPFSLLGFSLGGRVALNLYQMEPKKIRKLILLAPDGLKLNFWYWLATQSWAGNKFFAFTMKHPGWFFAFLRILNKLKIVNASIFKFVHFYIGNKEVRELLYARWTGLRRLKPHIRKIKMEIRENNSQVKLIYGKYDRIILPAAGEKFKKGIEAQCTLSVIDSGHQVLQEKHAPQIVAALRTERGNE